MCRVKEYVDTLCENADWGFAQFETLDRSIDSLRAELGMPPASI